MSERLRSMLRRLLSGRRSRYMKVARLDDGGVGLEFEPVEASLLRQLAGQVRDLVSADPLSSPTDAAVRRLLPDAYPDDAEANEEFRRFTASELSEQKAANAQRMVDDLADAARQSVRTSVRLDVASVGAWLRALTDIRLVVAVRLGIDTVETAAATALSAEGSSESLAMMDVYDWVGWVQESLVVAIDD